jgi:S1-C subfamily serine protease
MSTNPVKRHWLIALAAVAIAMANGCAGTRLWEPSREQVLQRILPSAVQIVVEQHEGRRVRTGSGVALASRPSECLILTAGHTVSGLVGQGEVYALFGGQRGRAEKTPARVVVQPDTANTDLALLSAKSDRCAPVKVQTVPALGESVWVVGFPWGRHMTLTSGIVSQVGIDDGSEHESAARLMVDAPVSYGSSGGGVFEAREGRLIGVIEGYSTARVTAKGADPAWYIDVPVPGQTFVTSLADVRRFLSHTTYADVLGPVGGGARYTER